MFFAGGEPFLHPNIFDILQITVNKGIRVTLLSNGLLLNKETADMLTDLFSGKDNFLLQISLDSSNPNINDQTRGSGKLVLDHIKMLSSGGIALQVATVLTQYNIDSAHTIIDELYPDVKCFHFMNVQKSEKALIEPRLFVTSKQSKDFWLRLREHAKQFPPDLLLPSLRITLRSNKLEDESLESITATFNPSSCKAGHSAAHIDYNFDVLGCDIAKEHTNMGECIQLNIQ